MLEWHMCCVLRILQMQLKLPLVFVLKKIVRIVLSRRDNNFGMKTTNMVSVAATVLDL
jgi:hypothetical protein